MTTDGEIHFTQDNVTPDVLAKKRKMMNIINRKISKQKIDNIRNIDLTILDKASIFDEIPKNSNLNEIKTNAEIPCPLCKITGKNEI